MTPDAIVSIILDDLSYQGPSILNKKIMEPSFGDGIFLVNIVQRMILAGQKEGLFPHQIQQILKENIYGIEKDEILYYKAIHRLESLLDLYQIPAIDWEKNLLCKDALEVYKSFAGQMDYVVGNPPYIRIHNIPKEERSKIKELPFSNGTTDLYLSFYVIGFQMLKEDGKLGYISPNSFLKNRSQQSFRDYLIEKKYLLALYDFKSSPIFPDAMVYPCICLLDKGEKKKDSSFSYRRYDMYKMVYQTSFFHEFFKEIFFGKDWYIEEIDFINQNASIPTKIKDIANIQVGIATNRDFIYIFRAFLDPSLRIPYMGKHTDLEREVYFEDKNGVVQAIESGILRRCVKASRFKGSMENWYILFPYTPVWDSRYIDEKGLPIITGYTPMNEDFLSSNYPNAYRYLQFFYEELKERDMDPNLSWFLFGRNQGIQNSGFKKIIFPHILPKETAKITPYFLEEDVVVYSGFFATIPLSLISPSISEEDKKEGDIHYFNNSLYDLFLEEVFRIFRLPDFLTYCLMAGKNKSGNYIEIPVGKVKNFDVNFQNLPE